MGELRLSTAELAKHFTDAAGLEAAEHDRVPLIAAGREAEAALTVDESLSSGDEASCVALWQAISGSRQDMNGHYRTKHFLTAARTFSTLTSEKPLILARLLDVVA